MAVNQPSTQQLGLQNFAQVLGNVQVAGTAWKTVVACLLLFLVPTDCLLLLREGWQIEAPVFAILAGAGPLEGAMPIVLILQALGLWFGISLVRDSTLHSQIESSPAAIVRFGLGDGPLKNAHYGVMAVPSPDASLLLSALTYALLRQKINKDDASND